MSDAGIAARRTDDPDEARRLVRTDGAAILTGHMPVPGESWPEFGVGWARRVLGGDGVQVVAQFEASDASSRRGLEQQASRPADDPFLTRLRVTMDEDLWLHNDGYAVGDEAPDQLFLLCEQPAREGGANVLVDAVKLLAEIEGDDPALYEFLTAVPIDQTEPTFDVVHEPVARTLPAGRVQVRRNPYQRPLPEAPQWHQELVDRWAARCVNAAASAPGLLLARGELACFDNYRVLHGRRPYVGAERTAHSIWGWTTSALAVQPLERELVF